MKSKKGGKRENSGRKPIKDKKKQICFYLNESEVKKIGGKNKIKDLINQIINEPTDSGRFLIDFFELSFLAEACIPPRPIARSMFWGNLIDRYYDLMTISERKNLFDWMNRNEFYKKSLEKEEDTKIFHARYDPENQYLVKAKDNESGNELEVMTFLYNGTYRTGTKVSVAKECIIKIDKIEKNEA